MAVILINCATLGMFQPCEDAVCDSQRCKLLKVSEQIPPRPFALRRHGTLQTIPLSLSDLRRRDLPLLYGRNVYQDAGHGHRR